MDQNEFIEKHKHMKHISITVKAIIDTERSVTSLEELLNTNIDFSILSVLDLQNIETTITINNCLDIVELPEIEIMLGLMGTSWEDVRYLIDGRVCLCGGKICKD